MIKKKECYHEYLNTSFCVDINFLSSLGSGIKLLGCIVLVHLTVGNCQTLFTKWLITAAYYISNSYVEGVPVSPHP